MTTPWCGRLRPTGACPPNTVPVYRFWDGRPDAHHRWTISPDVRKEMLARGWLPEGYGPDGGSCARPPFKAICESSCSVSPVRALGWRWPSALRVTHLLVLADRLGTGAAPPCTIRRASVLEVGKFRVFDEFATLYVGG